MFGNPSYDLANFHVLCGYLDNSVCVYWGTHRDVNGVTMETKVPTEVQVEKMLKFVADLKGALFIIF